MEMTRTHICAVLATTALVSACSGGGTTVLDPGPNGLPYAQAGLKADQNTMTNTYRNIAFKGDASRAVYTENAGTNTVTNATTGASGQATLKIVSPTQIRVTLGGQTVTMNRQSGNTTIAGATGTLWQDTSGTVTGIFGLSGTGSNALNSIFFSYLDQTAPPTVSSGTVNYSDTFVVSGFETDPAELSGNPTATYTGTAALFARKANGTDIGTQHAVLESGTGMNLTANFGSGALTGTLSGPTEAAIGTGNMVLDVTGSISGNGFTGTFVESGISTSSVNLIGGSTELSGHFYGVNGKEIGGVISAGIASGGAIPQNTVASGVFYGKR